MSLLSEADAIISGDRREAYGHVSVNFKRIGDMWSTYLGVPVSPRDVANLMILLKVSRDKHSPKRDNPLDIAGYAGCIDQLDEAARERVQAVLLEDEIVREKAAVARKETERFLRAELDLCPTCTQSPCPEYCPEPKTQEAKA